MSEGARERRPSGPDAESQPRTPRSLAVSTGDGNRPDAVRRWVDRLAGAGVEAVQIREKTISDRRLLEMVRAAVEASAGRLRVLVNGRFDLAAAAAADGVHLPADGLPTAAVRRELGPTALLGRSTHRREEIVRAAEEGADYVTFGPVYATPAKARFGPPQGLEALSAACSHGLPVLAIGGVDDGRLADLAAAGCRGVAAIRLFQTSDEELAQTLGTLRERFAP